MPRIGVRELRERTAEVLRRVREEKAEYVITDQGHPIALLLPVDTEELEAATLEAGGWEAYASLAESLRQAWPSDQPTQTLIDDMRQE